MTESFCSQKVYGSVHLPLVARDAGATTSPPREDTRGMASPGEQDAHTRHVGTAWRTQSDGAAGAVKAARPHGRSKRAFDLSHQTLAAWPETRRGSAETGGRAAGAWRSGARRPDRHAGREPKGASFRILLLVMVMAIDIQQLQRENHQRGKMRRMPITGRKRERKNIRRRGKSGSAGGASALPRSPKGNSASGSFGCAATNRKKGLPANRQPLHKGASGMSEQRCS